MQTEAFTRSLETLLPWLVGGTIGFVGLYLALALARLWGWRQQQRGGGCGGIDLDRLRRQRDAGEISQDDYEAVRARIAGADDPANRRTANHAASRAEPPIEPDSDPDDAHPPDDDDGETPERSRTDGQA